MGGSISTETARTTRQAGVRLQIRQTALTTAIVFHDLAAWYLVIQTLVTGNCLPEVPPGEVAVPHAIWNLAILPVGLFGLLAVRHEVEPDPDDFINYIRLFYFVLAMAMLGNAVATGLFSWELWQCATNYCLQEKGFLIGGNVVLHAVVLLLEAFMIGLAYLYARDLRHAFARGWQPHWRRKKAKARVEVSSWTQDTHPKKREHDA